MSIIVEKELVKFLKREFRSDKSAAGIYHAGVRCCAQLVHRGVPVSVILSDISDESWYSIGDKVYVKGDEEIGEIVAKSDSSRHWIIKNKNGFGTAVHDSGFSHLRKWAEE